MKKAIVIILVLAVLVLIVYRIATHQQTQMAQSIEDIQREQGVPVETQTVEKSTLTFSRQFSGTIEGYSQTSAIANLMETVKEVHVEVGDKVSTDDVLVELDKTNPQAQYQQAKLARDNAVTEHNRIDALFKQGAVSKQTLDQITLAKDIAESNFSNANKLLEITAPIDGIVTDVMFKPGELVSPGDAVATISNMDKIKCKLWVGEADHDRIKIGQKAVFSPSISNPTSDKQIMGKVSEIALSADRESHLYRVVVNADNTQGWLRPGQLVPVQIIIESIPNILTILKDAIITQNNITYVYKVENNIATLTPITLGKENRKHVQVIDGLTMGDTIVVYGMNRLQSGDRVKIVSGTEEVVNVSQ